MGEWIRKSRRAARAFLLGHHEPARAAMRRAAEVVEWLALGLALIGAHGWSVLADLAAALLRLAACHPPARLVRRVRAVARAMRAWISAAIIRRRRR